ncbi:MAG: phosphoglycerate mutase family protein [Clostridiales bacterium]|nr:phosphoglycerate mutase family protein [Clostridiales bacterium]
MKITVIRHARVDFDFPRTSKPDEQIEASRAYNDSPIDYSGMKRIENDDVVFVSTLSRSAQTAKALFGEKEFIRSELFSEVPLAPFTRMNIRLPSVVWDICGRFAWNFRSGRQPEHKLETRKRADRAIDLIEEVGKDCYVVSHAFFMRTLFRQLRKRGYRTHSDFGWIDNLQQFVFRK